MERTHVAFTNHVAKQDAASVATLRQCRSEQREAIKTAKSEWILEQCGVVGELTEFCELDQQFRSSKDAWKAVKNLELGLDTSVVAGSGAARLRKYGSNTDKCTTDEEEAQARCSHFTNLLEREAVYKAGVLDQLEQHACNTELDRDITRKEVAMGIQKLNSSGPGLTGAHALAFQVLWRSGGEGAQLLFDVVSNIWQEEAIPDHWVACLLKILSKPGDQSDPSNCRGIQMLEVSYKIVGNIMRARSRVISEQLPEQRAESIDGPGSIVGPGSIGGPGSITNPITKAPLDHEAQTGFRSNRGTCDGTWNVGMAIAKRKEHGAES